MSKIISRLAVVMAVACSGTALAKRPANADSLWLVRHYTKKEVYIPMRDGKRLFTAIYEPKDKSIKHPILINRTPYSIAPYGPGKYKAFWRSYYMNYFRKQYIMVMQDVRGRYMSEGDFMDVRPFNPDKKGTETDEASDTYDGIDWLVKHVKNNNGNVGIYGISYPGFYAMMGALSGHPALKAASPQAPVTEWFLGDDFHHNGAFMEMDAFSFYSSFGKPRPAPTTKHAKGYEFKTQDNYQFYLDAGPLRNLARMMGDSVAFWKDLYAHPNYDKWWQVRNTRAFAGYIPDGTATLVVGGLFDAEDCFGAWNLYKAIEKKAKNTNKLVMGPWVHGGWARGAGDYLGNVRFATNNSAWYQEHLERPFFEYYLEGKGKSDNLYEASVFVTGENKWHGYNHWPPVLARSQNLYFTTDGGLAGKPAGSCGSSDYREYISDPAHPVPYTEDVHFGRTREYMTDDQRFASRRTDVLTYQTPPLTEDVMVTGPVTANLSVSISTTDADFVVKLIDVFPDDFSYNDTTDGPGNGKIYPMGGYQMLVRGDIMRGRYRYSYEHPQAFRPNAMEEVRYTMPDVAHTFKKGHRIMVQVQSSWFPLADRNPQQFVNIYNCGKADFVRSHIKVFSSPSAPSFITLPVME